MSDNVASPATPLSVGALDELIATLGEIRDRYVVHPERWVEPVEQVEAARYVGQMLSAMSEMYWGADPVRPRFVSIVDPGRKLQGDNPDAIYHHCRLDGRGRYRIFGRIDRECYTSFTVHGRADDGAMAGPLLGDVNDRDLAVADDGTYELILSGDHADATGPHGEARNWLELRPEAIAVIVRSYFELATSAQNDSTVHVTIDIESLDEPGPPPPLDDAVMAARMEEGIEFLRQVTLGQNLFGGGSAVPFASDVPNVLPEPFSFRDSGLPVPGAADIHYCMTRWELEPDEALVMRGTIPPGVFANVMLWNAHMQTLEYRNRRSSLNGAQIRLEDDGSYEIWVSAKDPGRSNWLDTEDHRRGTIFWRFLLPDDDPPRPGTEVVRLA